jgi:hypothetical protein
MDARHLPAWCERRQGTRHDGRYVVACYFNRDGHPVSKAHAEKVILTEYHPDGTPLLSNEALIEDGAGSREERMLVASSGRITF